MTRAAITPKVKYPGAGLAGPFSLTDLASPIPFMMNQYIHVKRLEADGITETLLVEGTDYSLTGGPMTGVLNLLLGPLAVGTSLLIYRRQPIAQDTDLIYADDFSSTSVEGMDDRSIEIETYDDHFGLGAASDG